MSMRKIGVIGSFAAGAALAFAPLAAASDTPDTPDTNTFDFSDILKTQIQSMNWLFGLNSTIAGVDADDITKGDFTSTNPNAWFDSIKDSAVADVQGDGTKATLFDQLIYGVDPIKAGLSDDPGAYNLFNGAEVKFLDAFNVELYGLLNNNELIPTEYLLGNHIDDALAAGGADGDIHDVAKYFFDFGMGDLQGYFGLFDAS